MRCKLLLLQLLGAVAYMVVAVKVDPALAQGKGGKDPAEAGRDLAAAVKDFALPVAIVLTTIGMGTAGLRGDWPKFLTTFAAGAVVVGFLTMPGEVQNLMERFVHVIIG